LSKHSKLGVLKIGDEIVSEISKLEKENQSLKVEVKELKNMIELLKLHNLEIQECLEYEVKNGGRGAVKLKVSTVLELESVIKSLDFVQILELQKGAEKVGNIEILDYLESLV
jgi:hypothetical protein